MKYLIIPNNTLPMSIDANSKEDAMISFAAGMDTDMNTYFKAVTEEEYQNMRSDIRAKEHRAFVKDWMSGYLQSDFGMTEELACDWADRAYDIYCKGEDMTEPESVAKAYEEYELFMKKGGIQ